MPFSVIRTDKYETGFVHDRREEFLLDSVDDAASLPTDSAAGSYAYTADMANAWQMSPSGKWVQVKKMNSNSGSSSDVSEFEASIAELRSAMDELADRLDSVAAGDNLIDQVTINKKPVEIVDRSVDIPLAGDGVYGVVTSSEDENKITILEDGTMTINSISIDNIYQSDGTSIVFSGGDSSSI